jgi:hypothetical protein
MGIGVYVATHFKNQGPVKKAFELLQAAGHFITHDWTTEIAEGKTGEDLEVFLLDCAERDFAGVTKADAVLVINHEHGCAMFTELGLALAFGALVVVVDGDKPPHNIFYNLPEVVHATSLENAVEIITRYGEVLARQDAQAERAEALVQGVFASDSLIQKIKSGTI